MNVFAFTPAAACDADQEEIGAATTLTTNNNFMPPAAHAIDLIGLAAFFFNSYQNATYDAALEQEQQRTSVGQLSRLARCTLSRGRLVFVISEASA